MGLMPLEYKDCITDSPYFRQKLQAHEKELDRTSQAIKTLTKEVKEIVSAAKELSRIQRRFSHTLRSFKFECIGNSQTDDEIVIGSSLKEFAKIVDVVEEARESVLDHSFEQIISPLENFRKEAIGGAKDGRKKFEKQTFKFYQNQEKYLALSTRKDDQTLQEADASVEMEQRCFAQASLEYVFLLQEVQERKKFEFVETLLSYMYSWLTFYHQGHEAFNDCTPYLKNLQERLQRTRENFQSTRQEAAQLKNKMLEKNSDPGSMDKMYTRQGYLFLMEKKAFGTTWTKHYCQYQKESRIFTMIPYNQIQQKITSTETLMLKTCVRRMSETIDKRFCFDLTAQDRDKLGLVYTLQALCEEDRRLWMDAMDGKEPPLPQMYAQPVSARPAGQEQTDLDAYGVAFITRAIAALEARGLEDQGLYRLVGVSSKVAKLLSIGLDPARCSKLSMDDPAVWETKTITSAVKQYFRNLPQPIMTYALHNEFISAASYYITTSTNELLSAEQDRLVQRVSAIHDLVHRLPHENKVVLRELIYHLRRVASKSDKNLMTVSNLGVCFGPTMLRPEEETVAAIMDIKFCNIVVEILIEHYEKIFTEPPSELPCAQDSQSLSPFSSSSSSPKSSPPPPHHHSGKHPQPVLQTVVTSYTTSEPQSVHFGTPTTVTTTTSNSSALQRSDASSNIKWSQLTPQQQYPSSQHSTIPPPPNAAAHIWGHSTSSSSLNSGLNHGLTSHSSLNSLTSSHHRDGGGGGGGHHYDGGGGGAPTTSNHYHPHRTTSRVPATTSNRAGGGLQGACSSSTSNLLLLGGGSAGRSTSSADAAVGSSSVLTTNSSSSGGSSSSGASQLLAASAAATSADLLGSLSGSSSNLLLSNGGAPLLSSAASRASRLGIASAIATVAGAPLTFVNPLIGVDRSDGLVSTSSSSESLCSRSSREHNPGPSSSHHHSHQHHPHHHPPHHSSSTSSVYHHHHHQKQQHQSSSSASSSSPPLSRARLGTAYPPTFKQHMETNSLSGVSGGGGGQPSLASLPSSVNNNNTVQAPPSKAASNGVSPGSGRKPWPSHPRLTAPPLLMGSSVASTRRVVRTLYNCVGENESELSFEPNVYLTNVQPTREPGWLMASLNGREGMVPENYVQAVDEKNLPPHLQLELADSHRNTDV